MRRGVSPATVYNVVRDYSTQRLSYVLRRREHKNPPRKRIVTGEQEARIVALACGEAPEGHARWSIRLLREKVVELEIVESIGRETIRTTLKNEASASPEKAMVHSEQKQRRIRCEDGGCSGGLRPALPMTADNVTDLDYKGSYLNYYVGNEVVLVPVYGDANDAAALEILAELYAGRELVPIDVTALYQHGGMLHCVTQQQPKE